MNIFKKLLKKLLKKYYFEKDLFSSPNLIINKKRKNKVPSQKDFEKEERYNKFYSSPSWKHYQQEKEMDVYLHRSIREDNLLSIDQRLERVKAIEESVKSGEIYFNNDEWYQKNKHRLWKYQSNFKKWYNQNKDLISDEWYLNILKKFKK